MGKTEQGLDALLLEEDLAYHDYSPAYHDYSMAFLGDPVLRNDILKASGRLRQGGSHGVLETSQSLIHEITGSTVATYEALRDLESDYGIPRWFCPFITRLPRKWVTLDETLRVLRCDTDINALSRNFMAARLSAVLEEVDITGSGSRIIKDRAESMVQALKDNDEQAMTEIAEIPSTRHASRSRWLLSRIIAESSQHESNQAVVSAWCWEITDRSVDDHVRAEMSQFCKAVRLSTRL